MKDTNAGTNGAPQSAKSNQLTRVSERKLKANRENAKKSTGPKTPRGKAFSCRNAVKHGLFVNYVTDFEALDEDPEQYKELINGLWDQYQPVGRAEELQVERIALCFWRLKRGWRHENAVNLAARRDFVNAEMEDQEEYCKEWDKKEAAVVALLQIARKELHDTGDVSQELKQRIFAIMPGMEETWSGLFKQAEDLMEQPRVDKMGRKASRQFRSQACNLYAVTAATACFAKLSQRRAVNVREIALGRHAIPDSEALDRILRYETTADRCLSRALQQLEHLQRRRSGELLPPPIRVHLH